MNVQANWFTKLETFEAFREEALRDPERVFLLGARACSPNALSFAAVAEERRCFWVEGPSGWRARVLQKCGAWLAEEYRERARRQRNYTRKRHARIQNFLFIREK